VSPMLNALRFFAMLCSLTVVGVSGVHSQTPRALPDLIGADVLAADGTTVGEVAAITMGAVGDFAEIRMAVGSPLGIGKRIVIIPPTSFMIRRGAVVLDLSPTDVEALPTTQ